MTALPMRLECRRTEAARFLGGVFAAGRRAPTMRRFPTLEPLERSLTAADDSPKPALRLLCVVAALLLSACTGVEDKRIRELLNETGFGGRAEGVATVENYVAGGDAVVFFLDTGVVSQPGYEQLALLMTPQAVGIDGTIHVPYVGNVMVLGLTERELEDLVQEQLQPLFKLPLGRITARIVNRGKYFYAFGEAVREGRLAMVSGDMTVFEAIALVQPTQLANLGRIRLVRPDAQNPLTVVVNFREMVLTGNTTFNIPIQNNDILYIPPTFFGTLTRFVEKLLAPLAVVTRALFGITQAESSYDYLFGNSNTTRFLGRPFYFGF